MSAAQTPAGELLFLDRLHEQLWRLSPDSGSLAPVVGDASTMLSDEVPVALGAAGDDLLVQLHATRTFARLDQRFAPSLGDARAVAGLPRGDGSRIESTWVWVAMGKDGTELAACSDIDHPGGHAPVEGVVQFDLEKQPLDFTEPRVFSILLSRPLDAPLRFACRLGFPVVASIADIVYVLVPGDPTRIYRSDPGADAEEPMKPLRVFPEALSRWPDLPKFDTVEQVPPLFREVEWATMPIGLFGWEGHLYLLSRAPEGGGTTWSITRIDPVSDTLGGTMRINSGANHLLLVPGRERWAILEKGPVLSFGYQQLQRIIWLPAEQIRSWKDGGVLCPGLASLE